MRIIMRLFLASIFLVCFCAQDLVLTAGPEHALAPRAYYGSPDENPPGPKPASRKTKEAALEMELLVQHILNLWRIGVTPREIRNFIRDVQSKRRMMGVNPKILLRFPEMETLGTTGQIASLPIEFQTESGEKLRERIILRAENVSSEEFAVLEPMLGEQWKDFQERGYGVVLEENYRALPLAKKSLWRPLETEPKLEVHVSPDEIQDVITIGAGPAGLMLTQILSVSPGDLRVMVMDQGKIGQSWTRIPGTFVARFQPADFPGFSKYSKKVNYTQPSDIVEFLRNYARLFGFGEKVHESRRVESINRIVVEGEDLWEVLSRDIRANTPYFNYTRNVVIATGIFHFLRRLNVKGEDQHADKIIYVAEEGHRRLDSQGLNKDMRVVIVGIGNTALRLALLHLRRSVKEVTMILPFEGIRWSDKTGVPTDADPEYRDGPKGLLAWLQNPKSGDAQLTLKLDRQLDEVRQDKLVLRDVRTETTEELPYDLCVACTGFTPALEFMAKQGINVEGGRVGMDATRLLAKDAAGNNMSGLYILGVETLFRKGGVTVDMMKSQAVVVAGQIQRDQWLRRRKAQYGRAGSRPAPAVVPNPAGQLATTSL